MDRRLIAVAKPEPPTVVVIDHDAVVRAMLRAHLVRAGCEVLCAQDAIGGAHLVVEGAPSLVICEARLPQVNGYEFASALRADALTRDIPVVLLTVKGDIQPDPGRPGVVACLKKPVAPERLLRIVAAFAQPRITAADAVPMAAGVKAQAS